MVAPAFLGCALALAACGDDEDGGTLPGDTPCEKWESLALRDSCDFPQDCDIPAGCSSVAIAWIECAATDLDQCYCDEMSLQLNCRGSYLSNEGPALCMSEYQAFNDCVDQ